MKSAYGILLLIIAAVGAALFLNQYNSYSDTSKEYTYLCGNKYAYPVKASTIVYKLDYDNEGVFNSNGTLKIELKPIGGTTCSNPSLYLGIQAYEWETGEPYVWQSGQDIPPAFIIGSLHPLPETYANATFVPNSISGGLLFNVGETPVQTIGGLWTAYHYTLAGNNVIDHPQYGEVHIYTDVYYDTKTLVPVYSHLHVDIPKLNQTFDYTIQMVKCDDPLKTRLYTLSVTGVVTGLALALGVRDLLEPSEEGA